MFRTTAGLLMAAFLVACAAVPQTVAPTTAPAPSASPSPTAPLASGQAFGGPGCHPPSPVSSAELPEIRGTASGGEFWALVFGPVPVPVGKQIKIVWRMTGHGAFALAALGPTGQTARPDWGPEGHNGSTWDRPGDEWGAGFTFPTAGCWDIHATRLELSGDVYLIVK